MHDKYVGPFSLCDIRYANVITAIVNSNSTMTIIGLENFFGAKNLNEVIIKMSEVATREKVEALQTENYGPSKPELCSVVPPNGCSVGSLPADKKSMAIE